MVLKMRPRPLDTKILRITAIHILNTSKNDSEIVVIVLRIIIVIVVVIAVTVEAVLGAMPLFSIMSSG